MHIKLPLHTQHLSNESLRVYYIGHSIHDRFSSPVWNSHAPKESASHFVAHVHSMHVCVCVCECTYIHTSTYYKCHKNTSLTFLTDSHLYIISLNYTLPSWIICLYLFTCKVLFQCTFVLKHYTTSSKISYVIAHWKLTS
jgi:hypothetical protein